MKNRIVYRHIDCIWKHLRIPRLQRGWLAKLRCKPWCSGRALGLMVIPPSDESHEIAPERQALVFAVLGMNQGRSGGIIW